MFLILLYSEGITRKDAYDANEQNREKFRDKFNLTLVVVLQNVIHCIRQYIWTMICIVPITIDVISYDDTRLLNIPNYSYSHKWLHKMTHCKKL